MDIHSCLTPSSSANPTVGTPNATRVDSGVAVVEWAALSGSLSHGLARERATRVSTVPRSSHLVCSSPYVLSLPRPLPSIAQTLSCQYALITQRWSPLLVAACKRASHYLTPRSLACPVGGSSGFFQVASVSGPVVSTYCDNSQGGGVDFGSGIDGDKTFSGGETKV